MGSHPRQPCFALAPQHTVMERMSRLLHRMPFLGVPPGGVGVAAEATAKEVMDFAKERWMFPFSNPRPPTPPLSTTSCFQAQETYSSPEMLGRHDAGGSRHFLHNIQRRK